MRIISLRRIAALTLLVSLVACAPVKKDPPPTTVSVSVTPTALSFSPCEDEELAGLECATARAQLDWQDESAGTLDVAVARVRARKDRYGSLFINPGGPGASARDFLHYALTFLSKGVLDHYDVVAVDPRGTGGTTSLHCDVNFDEVFSQDISPDTPAEVDALVSADTTVAKACNAKFEKLLQHISTRNSARDMDFVRGLLGDEKINFLGFSYGTELGATYIADFPEHVGRFVLDGPLDPTQTVLERSLTQGAGFEKNLNSFFAWCDANNGSCAFAPDSAAKFDVLYKRLDTSPLKNTEGRVATNQTVMLFATATALYAEETYKVLGSALQRAWTGDGSVLLTLFDAYMGRSADGSHTSGQFAYRAIYTADYASPTVAEQESLLITAKSTLPRLWPLFSTSPHEDPWPQIEQRTRPTFSSSAKGTVVVVAAKDDPATPYAGGVRLAEILDAPLITRNGSDHTSYPFSTCVRNAVDTFLVERSPVAQQTECD